MTTVVTGTVVITIGIHLSTSAFENATKTSFDGWVAFTTIIVISLVNIYAPDVFKRFSILIGMLTGYAIYYVVGLTEYGSAIDFTKVIEAQWFAAPAFVKPKFEAQTISIIVPVCIVLLAENLGHVKAIGAMVGQPLDRYLGRAILGDAVATIVSASGGSSGTTTYAENIGVMVTMSHKRIRYIILIDILSLLGGY